MATMPGHLLILGASVRAAAFSAARSGFLPFGADLFADVDLRRWARAVRVENYPEGLADAVGQAPPGPWLYTGGLENHPELVDRIAASRPLLGNRGDVLRAVRDPRRLEEQLRAAGLRYPPVAFSPERVPCDGSWLSKPLGSSGGLGIEVWRGKMVPAASATLARSVSEGHNPVPRLRFGLVWTTGSTRRGSRANPAPRSMWLPQATPCCWERPGNYWPRKGDSPHLCEAPSGPFRQMGTALFASFATRAPSGRFAWSLCWNASSGQSDKS